MGKAFQRFAVPSSSIRVIISIKYDSMHRLELSDSQLMNKEMGCQRTNLPRPSNPAQTAPKNAQNRPKSSSFCYIWSGHNRASPAFPSACNQTFSQIGLHFAKESACNPTRSHSFVAPQAYKPTSLACPHLRRFPPQNPDQYLRPIFALRV